jgi:hypothetical protein
MTAPDGSLTDRRGFPSVRVRKMERLQTSIEEEQPGEDANAKTLARKKCEHGQIVGAFLYLIKTWKTEKISALSYKDELTRTVDSALSKVELPRGEHERRSSRDTENLFSMNEIEVFTGMK